MSPLLGRRRALPAEITPLRLSERQAVYALPNASFVTQPLSSPLKASLAKPPRPERPQAFSLSPIEEIILRNRGLRGPTLQASSGGRHRGRKLSEAEMAQLFKRDSWKTSHPIRGPGHHAAKKQIDALLKRHAPHETATSASKMPEDWNSPIPQPPSVPRQVRSRSGNKRRTLVLRAPNANLPRQPASKTSRVLKCESVLASRRGVRRPARKVPLITHPTDLKFVSVQAPSQMGLQDWQPDAMGNRDSKQKDQRVKRWLKDLQCHRASLQDQIDLTDAQLSAANGYNAAEYQGPSTTQDANGRPKDLAREQAIPEQGLPYYCSTTPRKTSALFREPPDLSLRNPTEEKTLGAGFSPAIPDSKPDIVQRIPREAAFSDSSADFASLPTASTRFSTSNVARHDYGANTQHLQRPDLSPTQGEFTVLAEKELTKSPEAQAKMSISFVIDEHPANQCNKTEVRKEISTANPAEKPRKSPYARRSKKGPYRLTDELWFDSVSPHPYPPSILPTAPTPSSTLPAILQAGVPNPTTSTTPANQSQFLRTMNWWRRNIPPPALIRTRRRRGQHGKPLTITLLPRSAGLARKPKSKSKPKPKVRPRPQPEWSPGDDAPLMSAHAQTNPPTAGGKARSGEVGCVCRCVCGANPNQPLFTPFAAKQAAGRQAEHQASTKRRASHGGGAGGTGGGRRSRRDDYRQSKRGGRPVVFMAEPRRIGWI